MKCSTDIIECLRKINIQPFAFSSSIGTVQGVYRVPSNAIDYQSNYGFHTEYVRFGDEWWGVNFKRKVAIHSYRIKTNEYCQYVNNWNISLSNDNTSYYNVDSKGTFYPSDTLYKLNRTYKAQFLRVYGKSLKCSDYQSSFSMRYIKLYGYIVQNTALKSGLKRAPLYIYLFLIICYS